MPHPLLRPHDAGAHPPGDGLIKLKRWFGELFNKAAADRQAGIESIYVRGAALALDFARVLAFTYAYACLNASWWSRRVGTTATEDAETAEGIVRWRLDIAKIIEPHLK